MKPVLIIGASSFGRLLLSLLEDAGRDFAGYIDDFNLGAQILGRRRDLGKTYSPEDFDLVLAVGYRHLAARIEIFKEAKSAGFRFPPLVHPSAHVSKSSIIKEGAVIMAGANVDAFASVGELCVLWPGAIVSHDCSVGMNCFLSPGATVCGFVNIGQSTFMGAGSVVVDGVDVPAGSFIKAATRYQRGG